MRVVRAVSAVAVDSAAVAVALLAAAGDTAGLARMAVSPRVRRAVDSAAPSVEAAVDRAVAAAARLRRSKSDRQSPSLTRTRHEIDSS